MKVATWNVKNLFDPGTYEDSSGRLVISEKYTEERIQYFVTSIKAIDPDIIFMQEVQGEKTIAKMGESLGLLTFCARPDHRGIRNAVLYKESLKAEAVSLTLPSAPLPKLLQEKKEGVMLSLRRPLAALSLMYQGKKLSLYGLHLKSGLPLFLPDEKKDDLNVQSQAKGRALLQKMGEILALRTFATEEIKNGKEVCFLGDFNESTSSLLFGILKESGDSKFDLTDVMSGKSFDKTTHIHKGDRQTIDTLLVSPLLRTQIRGVEVRNEGLLDMSELPLDNMEVGSDHAPVVVTFSYDS